MVTDNQVRKLMKLSQKEETKSIAAAKAGMDEKTARKYLKAGQLPSQLKKEHTWRTREDPFEKEWGEVEKQLGLNSGFEAKTLFEELQRKHPGKYSDGQLRTFQRKVKHLPRVIFFYYTGDGDVSMVRARKYISHKDTNPVNCANLILHIWEN